MPLPEKILSGLEQLAKSRTSALKAKPAEGMKALDVRRIDAQRAPFEMAGTSKLKPAEIISNPLGDMPRGRVLDLNALGDWDLANFQPLERRLPTKVSDRAKTAYSPENVREFERYVRKGIADGGLNWYDMSPLSRPALQEMSPEDFLMAMNASASARSSVQDQIKRASLAWYYRKQGIPWPMTSAELSDVADPGYGHLAHEIHSKHLAPLVAGEPPNFSSIDQPKYASYHQNFMGNLAPLTADTHYQALHGFPMKQTYNKYNKQWVEAPDFSKNVDYPFAEAFSGERARRMGLPAGMYQSAGWVGGKEATGVRDARPFAAVYDELVGRTADQMEITPLEALKKHLRGEIPLMPIERSGGGEVPGYAGGGKVGGLEALAHYIRYRLPEKYATQPMRHLQDIDSAVREDNISDASAGKNFVGSARDIFSLGDNRLVKIAKRPRGLYEQSLEGLPQIAHHLPGLDWRSPDNEISVVERMKHTPEASEDFMRPMTDRYSKLRGQYWSMHRDDPRLNQMMNERGLGDFAPFDIHGPDFFLSPRAHWAMRNPDPRMPLHARGATLLDPGAIDRRIGNEVFEQHQAGTFRDVLAERLKSMGVRRTPEDLIAEHEMAGDVRPLEQYGIGRGTEDFLGQHPLWPPYGKPKAAIESNPPDQSTFGFADGGMIEGRLRHMKRMAGGGVARNWLRGVKGSKIDNVLENLKKRLPLRIPEGEQTGEFAGEHFKRDSAIATWIDKNLGNYIVREMGAPGDPLEGPLAGQTRMAVKKLAPADIPKHILGDAPTEAVMSAYAWRRAGGKKAYEDSLRQSQDEHAEKSRAFVDEMPGWLRKHYDEDLPRQQMKPHLLPTNHLHDIDEHGWHSYIADHMNGILDWMRQSDIPPDRLGRVSVPQALKASQDWHAQLAKKAEEERAGLLNGPWLKEHKKYPDGYRWVKYDPESVSGSGGKMDASAIGSEAHEQFKAALRGEGESMGHCVGDYCDDVLSGNTHIYSLRDPQGRPHVTVEVQPAGKGFQPDIMNGDFEGRPAQPLSSIIQIKGKANKKPNDEYLPYVQDFVRSGKWGEVGDLRNTDLYRRSQGLTGPRAALYDKASELHPGEYWTADQMRNAFSQSSPEVQDYYRTAGPEWLREPQGYARGGQVKPPMVSHEDFPRESPDEALMRARLSLEILTTELTEPEYSPAAKQEIKREIVRTESLIARLQAAGAKDGTGVKTDLALSTGDGPSPSAPSQDAPGGDFDEEEREALAMLGFGDGDPRNESEFIRKLMSEEPFA